jgi:hypothetical protein
MMFSRLIKTKTFWAALAAILTATEQIATGNSTLVDGLQIIVPAILAIFLRDGVSKTITNSSS